MQSVPNCSSVTEFQLGSHDLGPARFIIILDSGYQLTIWQT
jgi:hypothetical protein